MTDFLPGQALESYSRRDFLRLAGYAGAACLFPSVADGVEHVSPDHVLISILHTTDIHGHILPTIDYDGTPDLGGLARCVTQIRRWRRQNRNSILIDVGDVYQGTDVALRCRGALMIDLFNHLKYDAWVVGNHEFDWGIDTFLNAVQQSKMPVLASNAQLEGRWPGELTDKAPLSKVRRYIIKEFGGIRVAIIGVTTPGMPFWFRPEFTQGFDALFPVEPVRRAIKMAKGEGVDAIVVAGHMGLKSRGGGDDFANTVMALTVEFPEAAVFIAGHTHQHIPSRLTNGVIFTQADHFGIHVGRVDLLFDRASKKLLKRTARCELMDGRFRLDRIVLSRSQALLNESEATLNHPIGELAESFRVRREPDETSDIERLIGIAILESLREHSVPVDGAIHGLFDEKNDLAAGTKTVRDVWTILPYENFLVTALLTPEQIQAVMEETFSTHENRGLIGFNVWTEGAGAARRITSITREDGQPLERGKRYAIAFNTFDSRSAGHRFMKLRALLETPETNCQFHPIQTRDALIEYFERHKVLHRQDLTAQVAKAA